MANRYWVGGTADWDGTAGTKWALTSGGAGGQAVPTAADDVFFDAASGAVTCTISDPRVAQSINCTGFTGTLAGALSPALTVSGSVTFVAGMTLTFAGLITFTATGTLTSGGKTVFGIVINSGAVVTLGDALTLTAGITHNSGTLTTNNYNLTATVISTATTGTQVINFGSSTITLNGTSNPINFQSGATLTLNAGTSQINLSALNPTIVGAGKTFYNVTFTNTTALNTGRIQGANTFQNLTLTPPSAGFSIILPEANQTIIGTLNCTGASAIGRTSLRSGTVGVPVTLTVGTLSATDCDFRDITIAGTAAGSSPTRAGNLEGNSGINFPAPKNVYWNLAGTQDWNATGWAATSGGTPAVNNFPLAQDTAIFDNAGAADTVGFGSLSYNFGSINASNRTTAMTLNHSNNIPFYGSAYTLGTGVTTINAGGLNILTRFTVNITTAGVPVTFGFTNFANATINFLDAFNSTGTLTFTTGTINTNNYNITIGTFLSSGSATRTLNMGSGLWTIVNAGTTWNISGPTNLTINKGTANILFSNSGTSLRQFNGGGKSYNKFTTGGTGTNTTRLVGNNTFTELASIKTEAHTWEFTSGSTNTVDAWSIVGSPGNVVTIKSVTAGSVHNLVKAGGGVVSSNYLSISDSSASPASTWYAGPNSTNVSNNSGWIFTTPPAGPSTGRFLMLF